MYGHDISPTNDYFVTLSEQAVKKIAEALLPGAYAVNTFPILRHIPAWFPGAGFKRFAAECKTLTDNMQNVPFNFVRKNTVCFRTLPNSSSHEEPCEVPGSPHLGSIS
jgi:hypothetical protein